ncbi:Polysaccharide monooxygenase Cel61a [Colletotrichum siamense]|nr:Polysaccharide monooxygenase Cel61a [Colletotrichum siamense]
MGIRKTSRIVAALASVASVAAHGHVTNIVINGVSYRNYIPTQDPYTNNPPLVAGWSADQKDNGFVDPSAYNTPDIICHKQAASGKGRITVAAGDTIQLQWTEWPDSHKGPVMDFLANCNGPCNAIDKTALRFFKIDGAGLIDPPQQTNKWAASALIANGNAWLVRIPSNIAPGHYVLRHDIIALHSAGQQNGAQSYPQCINLEITGEGTYNPPGVLGTALYGANDPGIYYNIYRDNLNDYVIPGPAIISGGVSMIPQSRIAITASASATPYGTTIVASSSRAASSAVVSSSKITTSSFARSSTSTTSSTSSKNGGSSTPTSTIVRTSTSTLTTLKTLTSVTPTTTKPPSNGEVTQGLYQQCGGNGWTGPTACPAYAACSTMDSYYAQCRPTPAAGEGQPLIVTTNYNIGFNGITPLSPNKQALSPPTPYFELAYEGFDIKAVAGSNDVSDRKYLTYEGTSVSSTRAIRRDYNGSRVENFDLDGFDYKCIRTLSKPERRPCKITITGVSVNGDNVSESCTDDWMRADASLLRCDVKLMKNLRGIRIATSRGGYPTTNSFTMVTVMDNLNFTVRRKEC